MKENKRSLWQKYVLHQHVQHSSAMPRAIFSIFSQQPRSPWKQAKKFQPLLLSKHHPKDPQSKAALIPYSLLQVALYVFFVIWPGAPQWAKLRLPDLREQNLSWPSGQWKMGQLGTLLRGLTSLHGPCAAGSVNWSSKDLLITSSSPTVVSRQIKVLI